VSEHLMTPDSPARAAWLVVRPTPTGATFGSIPNSAHVTPPRQLMPALSLSPRSETPVHASCRAPVCPSATDRAGTRALRAARTPMASSNRCRSELATPPHSGRAVHLHGFYRVPLPLMRRTQHPRSSTPTRDSQQGYERHEKIEGFLTGASSAASASLLGRPSTTRITSLQPFVSLNGACVLAAPPNPACSGLAALGAASR
jgi:hypothetical protein